MKQFIVNYQNVIIFILVSIMVVNSFIDISTLKTFRIKNFIMAVKQKFTKSVTVEPDVLKPLKTLKPEKYDVVLSMLDYVTDLYIVQYIEYTINAQAPIRISNKELLACISEVVLGINSMISNEYRCYLYNYFTEEGLVEYITFRTRTALTRVAVQKNMPR